MDIAITYTYEKDIICLVFPDTQALYQNILARYVFVGVVTSAMRDTYTKMSDLDDLKLEC